METRIGEGAVFRLSVPAGGDPVIRVTEVVDDAQPPRMRDGEVVYFTFDDGVRFPVRVESTALGDTWAVDAVVSRLLTPSMLASLRRSHMLFVMREDAVLHQAALEGFDAAYGALSQHCGPSAA